MQKNLKKIPDLVSGMVNKTNFDYSLCTKKSIERIQSKSLESIRHRFSWNNRSNLEKNQCLFVKTMHQLTGSTGVAATGFAKFILLRLSAFLKSQVEQIKVPVLRYFVKFPENLI